MVSVDLLPPQSFASLDRKCGMEEALNTAERSAIHEAGHVVAALALNLPFEKHGVAARLPEHGWPVTFTVDFSWDHPSTVRILSYYILALAGRTSEELADGKVFEDGLRSDNEIVKKCTELLSKGHGDGEHLLACGSRYVEQLLNRHRESVRAIAILLLERHEISIEESRDIFGDHSGSVGEALPLLHECIRSSQHNE